MGFQADQVRDDIVDRVLALELMPGDRIDETDLRERLSLSGTPIREALISLEAEGVVERRPRGGALITSLDLEGLMKMIEVQAETEGSVAALASRRANKAQAVRLRETAQACMDYAKGQHDLADSYFDLNVEFHRAMIAAAGNEYTAKAVYNVANRMIAYLAARHELPGAHMISATEHMELCDVVLDADAERARELMIRHTSFTDSIALDVLNAVRPST